MAELAGATRERFSANDPTLGSLGKGEGWLGTLPESPRPAPGRIFISYRREDTAYPAGWLFDQLTDHFGAGQVFKDVDSIQLGDDFVEVITRAVASCEVLLALIGEEWLTISDAQGRRRLDDPDDFVRLEIEAALARKIRVIPILVDGASMPRADQLPDSLVNLVRRQALELSPTRFDFDAGRLLKVLDRTLAQLRATPEDAASTPAPAADPNTMEELAEASERGERAERPPIPSGPAAGSAPSATPRRFSTGGYPPGKARRRLATRARVLAGTGVAAVLMLMIVGIVARSGTTPSTTGTVTVTPAATGAVTTTPLPTRIEGTDGNDDLIGTQGNDRIDALAGDDTVRALGGSDTVYGNAGGDRLFGGGGPGQGMLSDGDDQLFGGDGNDELHGQAGNDDLRGQVGNDKLDGGPGDDRLDGGPGDDTFNGSPGSDTCIGGPGNDTFVDCEVTQQ